MNAVSKVYSGIRKEPLLVGSVKTNIGHCEAAAGIASLIKVILCIQEEAIPAHLNLNKLNPRINLETIPAKIPLQLTPWTPSKKIAAISSFSMSATNAHVIVQEPPKLNLNEVMPDGLQMIAISAKSEESLKLLIQKYIAHLQQNPSLCITDIAYGANIGRAHFRHRIAVVAANTPQLLFRLEKRSFQQGKAATSKNKVAFIFTGQGSQYFGMAKGLDIFPAFRKAIHLSETLYHEYLNESLMNVVWKDESLLDQTLYCQPAIFCIQYCLLQIWSSFGIKADYVLGHSVGEFAAAVCAGILCFEDALKLVVTRSKLVNSLPPGSMMALITSQEKVSQLIKAFTKTGKDETWIDIAAVNSSEEVVVSAKTECINSFVKFCVNNGVRSVKIPATHAFHSREMDSILMEYGKTAETVTMGQSNSIYISGTLAKAMEPSELVSMYWQRHLRDTVRFSDAINLVWRECKTLVEVGPQPILLGLALANIQDTAKVGTFCPSLRRKDEPYFSFHNAMCQLYVSGIEFNWAQIYGIRKKAVSLPLYPFERQKYWFVDDEADTEASPLLHPLLGRQFQSPLPELVFCQTYRLKDLSYFEDHKVGDHVIVPMAAILESFMAASREVLQGGSHNRFPITIENLAIEAALHIESKCEVQTIIKANTQGAGDTSLKYSVSISRKLENHLGKWKRHAHATFTPSSRLPDDLVLDIDAVKSRLIYKESLEDTCKLIAEAGIQFGPTFQRINSAWYGPGELLSEINMTENQGSYICHPIVLDSMIQTYAFRKYIFPSKDKKKTLSLPISIRRFTWLSRVPSKKLYAYSAGADSRVTL